MRLELSAVGLASVRYGVSPLFELAALLRRLRRGSRGALAAGVWGDWSAQYKGLYSDPDASTVLRLLGGRVGSLTWVAGTPSMGRSFAEDLDALRDLTDADLVADVERTAPDLLPGLELGHFRRQVEAGMVRMWRVLLEPVWPAVRAVAEHEVSRATAVLQRLGWNGVFDTVCRGVSWDGHGLELSGLDQVNPGVESRGGLVLMPSVFVMDGPVVRLDPVWFAHAGVSRARRRASVLCRGDGLEPARWLIGCEPGADSGRIADADHGDAFARSVRVVVGESVAAPVGTGG